jgi:urease beta subunit
MAIEQVKMNKVKNDATHFVARAKARQAEVTAHVHVLKAKRQISRSKA